MKNFRPTLSFAPAEVRRFIMPISLSAILVLLGLIVEASFSTLPNRFVLFMFGFLGIAYMIIYYVSAIWLVVLHKPFGMVNALITGIGLGIAGTMLPENLNEILHILLILGVVAIAATSGRRFAYIALGCLFLLTLPEAMAASGSVSGFLDYFMPIIVSISILEVINRIQETATHQIQRLQIINRISREIMHSLDTEQTLSLLDKTIKETLKADTFFIGILEGDEINLKLFYDDGQYYNGTRVPIKKTLSGWVIKNQKELYLPDLREKVELEDVDDYVIGQERTSLSWIGTPLMTSNITGVISLSSYTANAFDRADLELLISLGQQVTLALDNAIRHAKVERQAQNDSMTGVYNHGYFLQLFEEHASKARTESSPLSLIMLDVDFFKRYNDRFGHLVGDRVLNALCSAIKTNIKQTDAVGRWGGEEFIVSLPGATGDEAIQVANRIRETLARLQITDRHQETVPVPTLSQGVAVFMKDADEIFKLIDVADKRLYIAKDSGGNRIEPVENIWNQ